MFEPTDSVIDEKPKGVTIVSNVMSKMFSMYLSSSTLLATQFESTDSRLMCSDVRILLTKLFSEIFLKVPIIILEKFSS